MVVSQTKNINKLRVRTSGDLEISPGGYIKTAKTENFSGKPKKLREKGGFYSDRNFFVSKSREFPRFHGVFFVFSVLTLLPGVNWLLGLLLNAGRPLCVYFLFVFACFYLVFFLYLDEKRRSNVKILVKLMA